MQEKQKDLEHRLERVKCKQYGELEKANNVEIIMKIKM